VQTAMLTAESFVSLAITPGKLLLFSQNFRNKTRESFREMCPLSQFVIFYRPLEFFICIYSPGKAKTILFSSQEAAIPQAI